MALRLLARVQMRKLFALVCVVACATSPARPAPSPAPVAAAPAPSIDLAALVRTLAASILAPAAPDPAPLPSPYSEEVRSVRFLATTTLRKQPSPAADKVGVIGKGARARPIAEAAGPGCATRWIEIAPRGWACETAVLPSPEEPTAAVELDADAEDVVRGVYGVVRGAKIAFANKADAEAGRGRALTGATSVRARGVVAIAGTRYWVTSGGELIDASTIAQISPSRFRGVELDDQRTLPLAWTHGKRRGRVAVRDAAAADAPVIGELAPRTVVQVVGEDGGFVRTPDGWIARGDLRLAALAEPPAEVAAGERWFDIDLDEQTLVAYEGARPVYATLVSTGKWDHKTPTEIARVASKLETATMSSDKRDLYSVADVPWTMYYDRNFALHTSYWHDGFGDPRSHGCVNLAPRDARALYHWSSPDVPPGWIAVYGDADNPGSLVRVRSRAEPTPSVRGYARQLTAERRDADAAVLRR